MPYADIDRRLLPCSGLLRRPRPLTPAHHRRLRAAWRSVSGCWTSTCGFTAGGSGLTASSTRAPPAAALPAPSRGSGGLSRPVTSRPVVLLAKGVVACALKGTQTGHSRFADPVGCRCVWLRGSST
jgi:hypothetical protein